MGDLMPVKVLTAADLDAIKARITALESTTSALSLRVYALEQPTPVPGPSAGRVSIGDLTTTEGDDIKLVQALVTRVNGTAAFSIDYETSDGTATAGQDYFAVKGTLNFAENENEKVVPITVVGDDTAEGDEQFTFRLLHPTGGAEIMHGEAIIFVHDNDVAGTVSVNDATVVEGNAGTVLLVFKVTRTGGAAPFQVSYFTSDGTATAGQDYTASSGTLNFVRGQGEITVNISVAGDTLVEGDEILSVDLRDPTNGAVLGKSRGAGTITNDDSVVVTPPPLPGPGLSVWLDFADGKSLAFTQSKATDIGDYVGPFVRQKCFRQIASGNGDYRDAFLVDFRPDADGKRDEVVVEFGTLFRFPTAGSPIPASGVTPLHLGKFPVAGPLASPPAYTVTISGNTLQTPVKVPVAAHYWRARWRWQSAPRPIVRNLADLVAMRAVMPLDRKYVYNAPAPRAVPWSGPMDNGPVTAYLPTTGGREDLGFTTEWAAAYLLTGDPGAEMSMRSGAEATGTMDFWVRDVTTGALVNTTTVPQLPAFMDAFKWSSTPMTIPGPAGPASWSYFTLDEAHMPSLGFVPWMLTDDPYYLEGAQAIANYGILETNYDRNAKGLRSLASTAQERGWGWNMRDIFQLAGFSPGVAPSWLLPRSHWRNNVLPDQLTYAMSFVNWPAPATSVFGLIVQTGRIPAFQLDYQCIVMGWIKWSGLFPEFDPMVKHVAKPRIVMSDPADTEGWDHRQPEPYYMPIGAEKTWAELWQSYLKQAPSQGWPQPPFPTDGFPVQNAYEPWWRAALAALSLAGLPRAREGHDFTAAQLTKRNPYSSNGYVWAIRPE